MQYHIVTYFDNDTGGVPPALQKGGRPLKSITARLKGKEGRVRGNLMGKRTNFSARTVITGDPNISISEVGVPQSIAKNLTFPEVITSYNLDKFQEIVNAPYQCYPGAKYVIKSNGTRIDLKYAKIRPKLYIGDTVERHLVDGDVIVFNRQPTLHKMSMMGHIVKVMPFSTFRLNLSCTTPYNADFDGDEMNLHICQSQEARSEILELSMVSKLVVSPQANKPVMGIVQDSLCGARKFTKRDTFLSREELMNTIMHIPEWNGVVPEPAIVKPIPLWTGKQLFSLLLPKIDYMGYHSVHPDEEVTDISPGDTKVVIKEGVLLTGIICKKAIGATQGGIIHIIWQDHGHLAVQRFMDGCQSLVNYWLGNHGFSVGVGDMITNESTKQKVKSLIDEAHEKVNKVIFDYRTGDTKQFGGFSLEATKENAISKILNAARDSAGKTAQEDLPDENNVKQMVGIWFKR